MSLGASSSSLKFEDHKRLRRGSRNFRGKGGKFNVKASGRESIAEAMTIVVYRINYDGLIADTNNSQGEHPALAKRPLSMLSGMKADGIIAKIGLDYSHRTEARSFVGGFMDLLEK
ncbi:hypothetical protein EPI10_031964 [Gossypium australe]|uniref:Uncharacterized protein n=1 Tax=Gossypium australe TaxID=47621 RepID=A0A5B6X4Y1_9ROSI|nr:hypothetical protein EPI10_031964 [Gossypium australe]